MTAPSAPSEWPEAMATVLTCRYRARAGRAIAFGLPSSEHFEITYNYWAGGSLHEGEIFSAKAMPAGTLFPIRYDPLLPSRSTGADGSSPSRTLPVTVLGLAAAAFACAVLLLAIRGC